MEVHFSFLDEYSHQRTCTVNATASAGTNPRYMSFYKLKCMENDWSVSWGYDTSSDAAVMTLLKYVSITPLAEIRLTMSLQPGM